MFEIFKKTIRGFRVLKAIFDGPVDISHYPGLGKICEDGPQDSDIISYFKNIPDGTVPITNFSLLALLYLLHKWELFGNYNVLKFSDDVRNLESGTFYSQNFFTVYTVGLLVNMGGAFTDFFLLILVSFLFLELQYFFIANLSLMLKRLREPKSYFLTYFIMTQLPLLALVLFVFFLIALGYLSEIYWLISKLIVFLNILAFMHLGYIGFELEQAINKRRSSE